MPQAQSQHIFAGTDQCPDEALDLFMGLTQEVAELLTPDQETGMWKLEDLHTFLMALMPVELFRADIRYFYAFYGATEFALQLGQPETAGAILHLRCPEEPSRSLRRDRAKARRLSVPLQYRRFDDL